MNQPGKNWNPRKIAATALWRIEVKDAFSERNDAVLLRALKDAVVVIANARKEKKPGVSVAPGRNDTPGTLLVRVYQSMFTENGAS